MKELSGHILLFLTHSAATLTHTHTHVHKHTACTPSLLTGFPWNLTWNENCLEGFNTARLVGCGNRGGEWRRDQKELQKKKKKRVTMMPMLPFVCRLPFLFPGMWFLFIILLTSTPQDTEAVTHKYTQPSGSSASSPPLKHQLRGELASLNVSFSCQTNLSHEPQNMCETSFKQAAIRTVYRIFWDNLKSSSCQVKSFKSKSNHKSSLCSLQSSVDLLDQSQISYLSTCVHVSRSCKRWG